MQLGKQAKAGIDSASNPTCVILAGMCRGFGVLGTIAIPSYAGYVEMAETETDTVSTIEIKNGAVHSRRGILFYIIFFCWKIIAFGKRTTMCTLVVSMQL